MKVVITNAKAPWPEGAKVGDVVEVAELGRTPKGEPVLPGCLVGKCKPADAGAEAAHTYEQQLPTPVVAETALATLEVATSDTDKLAEDLKVSERLLAEARIENGELLAAAERLTAERDKLAEDLKVAQGKVAELEAELAKKKK